MIYADWHVAYVNQLMPSETSAFLGTIFALENDKLRNVQLRENAITEVTQTFDESLKAYALPAIVKIALSKHELRFHAVEAIYKICKNNSTALDLARNIFYQYDEDRFINHFTALDAIREFDWDKLYIEAVSLEAEDYVNNHKYLPSILLFAAIESLLLSTRVDMAQGNEEQFFVERSKIFLSRGSGRLPLLMAYKFMCAVAPEESKVSFLELISILPKWYEEPNMIEIYLLHETNGKDSNALFDIFTNDCFFDDIVKKYNIKTTLKLDSDSWLLGKRKNENRRISGNYYQQLQNLWHYTLCHLALVKAVRENKQ